MRIEISLCALLIFAFNVNYGQEIFNGSFLMTFASSTNAGDYPMLWNVEPDSTGGRMALEIQDEMTRKGISKRILFNPSDSTWTMLMEYNKVKQGSRIHAADMYRPKTKKVKQKKITKTLTNSRKRIEGYTCKKIVLESEDYYSEIWYTESLKFDLAKIYNLLSHCGMISDFVKTGEWYKSEKFPGMILEVFSQNKSTEEFYTLTLSQLKPGQINESFFTTAGFRISDIPEGQNCGTVLKTED